MRLLPLRAAVLGCALLASVTTPAVATAAPPDDLVYVALGDSAAAGPLLPQMDVTSPGCLRSDLNYPTLVAGQVGADVFRDVTCSSATTEDFGAPQSTFAGPVPPQYDALSRDTDVVTVHIGANDIGLVSTVTTCLNALPEPVGVSCADRLTAGGVDQVSEEIAVFAPRIGQVTEEIRSRAPRAKVYFVGYGTYVPPGGCWPVQPVWGRDADYIQAKIAELNAAIAQQAKAHRARYIDQTAASVGHDTCAPPATRWFEGLVPTSPTTPFHPTVLGMQGTGFVVAHALIATRAV